MKRLYIAVLILAAVLPVTAQDTYESARLLGSDLNGTARYVGMGGAMEALGADISTISTNPAGIGLFRHSVASVSFGFVSQPDGEKFDDLGKMNLSFDQAVFVYSSKVSRRSFVNVGFNYHKSRNFDQLLAAANSLRHASVNGLSYYKSEKENVRKGGFYWDVNNSGDVIGYEDASSPNRAQTFSQMDYINFNALNPDFDEELNLWMGYNEADYYLFNRAHRGWISDFDFNVSGNQSDRFYWGVTLGIHDVRYKGYSVYTERLTNINDSNTGYDGVEDYVDYMDDRKIEGTGIDIKAGVILRPIEESAFRVGLSVSTPTWYELTTTNDTYFNNDSEYGIEDNWASGESYDFRYFTPWKFGASIGHTIGNNVALGFSYEIADYSTSVNRILSGQTNSNGYERSYSDPDMKYNTKSSLKTVSLLKAGIEYKPDPALAVRLGYNYQSSAYEKNGYRDAMLDSPGVAYSSTTDYVNWGDTHRITCGLGFRAEGWNIDLAYQYNTTSGDFHPMQVYDAGQDTGVMKVYNKRHQLLLTLGYTF